jgi:hypothetical protein
MLCEDCECIFREYYDWSGKSTGPYPHHTTFRDVREAVQLGCYICSLLREWIISCGLHDISLEEPELVLDPNPLAEKIMVSYHIREVVEPVTHFVEFGCHAVSDILSFQLFPVSGRCQAGRDLV